jgi:hypothetical protein
MDKKKTKQRLGEDCTRPYVQLTLETNVLFIAIRDQLVQH